MFGVRPTGSIAIAVAVLIALAGCSGGGIPGAVASRTPPPDEPAADADGGTGCLAGRTWVMDIDDAATQLGELMASNGMDVRSSTGEGRQTFEFDDSGDARAGIDVTYTITVATSDLEMTLVQTHGGDSSGEWAWQGDSETVTFPAWDNAGYSVQTQVFINGAATDIQMDIPTATLGDSSMETVCSGAELLTHVTGSPFTTRWTAEG